MGPPLIVSSNSDLGILLFFDFFFFEVDKTKSKEWRYLLLKKDSQMPRMSHSSSEPGLADVTWGQPEQFSFSGNDPGKKAVESLSKKAKAEGSDRLPYVENIQENIVEKHYQSCRPGSSYALRLKNWVQHRLNGVVLDTSPGIVNGGRGKVIG